MNKETEINYKDILIFYLPLLLNFGMMTLSAPFINYGMGKAVNVNLALAAFTAAFSIMIVLNSFTFCSKNVFNPHIKDRKSYTTIRRFFYIFAAFCVILNILLGTSQFGTFIFQTLLNTGPEVTKMAKEYMLYIIPIPFLIVFRSGFQGVATVYKQTIHITIGTLLRLFSTTLLIVFSISAYPNKPAACAGFSFSTAIVLEILYLSLATLKLRRFIKPTSIKPYDTKLNFSYLLRFTLPILVSSLAWTISFPLINSMIGNTSLNKEGLAGFGVIRSLLVFTGAPIYSLTTVVLILGINNLALKIIKRFAMVIILVATLLITCIVFTPFRLIIFSDIFNLQGNALNWASNSIYFFLFLPVFITLRTYGEGQFLRNRKPRIIGFTGFIRLITILISGILILKYYKTIDGVLLGTLLMIIASLSDALIMQIALFLYKKKIKCILIN